MDEIMDLLQTLRRLGQQSLKGWNKSSNLLSYQMPLIKKLYFKNGLDINLTCSACPEQYDVFKDGIQVAYYRLRHGEFTVTYPDVRGELLINEGPNGDGCFNTEERLIYLTKAMRKVLEKINL